MTTEPLTNEPHPAGPDQDHFAPLTPSVRMTLIDAMVEANSRRSEFIQPHHLLLGLVGRAEWAGWLILGELGIGEALAAAKMESRQVEADAVPRPAPNTRAARLADLPTLLDPHSRTVLKLAGEDAARMGSTSVDTAHLLIGILREGSVVNTQFGRLINSRMLDQVRMLAAQTQGQEQWVSMRNQNVPLPERIKMVEFPFEPSTLDLFDLLVEAGFAQSRAHVLNMFIGDGMNSRRHMISFAQIMVKEVRELREILRQATQQQGSLGDMPPASDAPENPGEPGAGPLTPEISG